MDHTTEAACGCPRAQQIRIWASDKTDREECIMGTDDDRRALHQMPNRNGETCTTEEGVRTRVGLRLIRSFFLTFKERAKRHDPSTW